MKSVHEEWRRVPGYSAYEVSNVGNLRSYLVRGKSGRDYCRYFSIGDVPKMLKPTVNPVNDHLQVTVRGDDGRKHTHYVCVLMLLAFVGPKPTGTEACHNDGNPRNDIVGNLRWDTRSSNQIDSVLHGTHHKLKFSAEDVRDIRAERARGVKLSVLAARYGVRESCISRVANGKRWWFITAKSKEV